MVSAAPSTMANPNDIRVFFDQALRKHQAGHYGSAEKLYRRVLGIQPNHRDSLHLIGAIRLEEKRYKDAIAMISKALGLGNDVSAICFNLARAYEEDGQLDEALAMFQRALLQAPNDADTIFGIGCVLLAKERNAEALDAFNKALDISPQHRKALNNKGLALKNLGRSEDALKCYVAALTIDAKYTDAILNLAILLEKLNRLDEAHEVYDQLLKIEPKHVGAMLYRGKYFSIQDLSTEAISCFHQVLAINPSNKDVLPHLIFERGKIADWQDFDRNITRMQSALERSETAFQPMYLARLIDSPGLMLKASQWMASMTKTEKRQSIGVKPVANRRIKVGYVSSDFNEKHPVFRVIEGVLALHDKARFDVHLFSLPHTSSEKTPEIPPGVSGTPHDLIGKSDSQKVEAIRNAELDIAVDLNGFTRNHGFELFGSGIAPVQVNYLGFPGTMGSTAHDYIVGDSTLLPKHSFQYFTEQVVWLPNSFFPANGKRLGAAAAPTRAKAGLPEQGFVFGCFSTIDRILPAVFASWMRILHAVEGSVLWLKTEDEIARNNILKSTAKHGLATDRIVFAQRVESADDHLARLQLMDLCLDTLPYNAHSTALDCLIAGVPVLTLPGEIFAARVASSLLQACGLPEFICGDRTSYEDLATKLAMTPELLQSVKAKLQIAQREAPLFDSENYTRNLEKAYTIMVERNAQGLPPAHFEVT
jgi:protein O-GlcNAc transferase